MAGRILKIHEIRYTNDMTLYAAGIVNRYLSERSVD